MSMLRTRSPSFQGHTSVPDLPSLVSGTQIYNSWGRYLVGEAPVVYAVRGTFRRKNVGHELLNWFPWAQPLFLVENRFGVQLVPERSTEEEQI